MNTTRSFVSVLSLTTCLACGGAHPPDHAAAASGAPVAVIPEHPHEAHVEPSAAALAAVAATDRSDDDRALDAGRHPAEMLTFFNVAAGNHVAELFAGGGYTTELLARLVGDSGQVFAQNSPMILQRFARAPLTARLAKPINHNVVAVEREFDAPLPPEAHDLDAVLFVLSYHDTVWMHADRAAMNAAVFHALRSGGVYGIVDHSAPAGSGARDVQTTHRIDEATLVAEVLAAGFRLDAEADFLRNPADARDWNDSPHAAGARRGTSDRFVLRFTKP